MMAKKQSCPQETGTPGRGLPQGCLSAENLSAELDGEYTFSPEEEAHLKHCARCRNLYASYRVIDDAVSRSLMVNCPKSAGIRIRKRVNRSLDMLAPMREHRPIRFAALAARVAAVVALAAMAGYLIFIDNPYGGELAEDTRPLPSAAAKRPFEPMPETSSVSPAGVDIRNLQLTAAGDPVPVRFLEPSSAALKAEHVAVIPDQVKHVWLFDPAWKAEQLENLLRAGMAESGIPLKDVQLKFNGPDEVRGRMQLTRGQTVVLTRFLAGRGLQLVSPVQPQPEQKLFAGTGREPVEYEAVLIPRGK